MDYAVLAEKLLLQTFFLRRFRPQKELIDSMRGGTLILHYLAHQENEALPSEISNDLDITTARVAVALNLLEHKGLITRRIDPSDRRKILVGLTPEGERLNETHRQVVVRDMTEMLRLLGEHDAREYVRITGRLAELSSKQNES